MRTGAYQDQTFGEILVGEGLITPSKLARVLGERESTTEPIGDLLVRLGLLTPKERARCIGKQMRVPFVDLSERELDPAAAQLIPHSMASRLCALPLERSATALSVAMADPLDITAIDQLRAHTGLEIDPVIAAEDDLREAISSIFGSYEDLGALMGEATNSVDPAEAGPQEEEIAPAALSLGQLRQMSERSPVIRFVNALITRAVSNRASDIHISPERHRVRVRYRVDGMLREALAAPKNLQYAMISRMKIMANMDIAETRAPQDGRITLLTPQGEYDFRVSSYPSVHGENLVIRILDKSSVYIDLDRIGLQADTRERLRQMISRPHGMVLVCGPTGSGKTTTLYGCINAINSEEYNVMTIEDPVEYQVRGIVQGNVNVKAGVTFASGLRTLVRQDPDVILVGEIRDTETARIAVEAALTGHLVLSTIHANDSAGAVTRLIDMGAEPFLVASALVGVLAQRLVRVICPRCAASYVPDERLAEMAGCSDLLQEEGFVFRRGAGCEFCSRRGYKGRTGIYELLEVNADVRRLILQNAPSQEIRDVALSGRPTLREDALSKLRQGLTTVEEILRVTIS